MDAFSVNPFFSIIVPVYNAFKTLTRCLDSIINQSFQDFEVVCVDDGSTDLSWSVLGEYASRDSRIRRFSQSNTGPSGARNRGIEEARGNYVLFVDADDIFYINDALNLLRDTIISNEGCELVFFAGVIASSDGVFPDDSKHNRVYDYGYQCMEENCLSSEGIVFGSVYVQCIKKSLIDDNAISFDGDLVYGEDRLFVCTLFYLAKKTVEVSNGLYCYVVNNDTSLMKDEKRRIRLYSDNRLAASKLDHLIKNRECRLPNVRKYIHGLYVQSLSNVSRKETDWRLVFRNASTLKLFIKDIFLFLGLFQY